MPLSFEIAGANGEGATIDANNVMAQLAKAGYQPQGLSADGQTMTLVDAQGPYEVSTQQALENLGWQVKAARPVNADYDNIQPGWRAAVNKLPDDASRRAFIEGQMRNAGVEQPKIVGGGRDWYVYNPDTNQYIGVTNNPEWDSSDLVEGGLDVARGVGSTLGAVGGTAVGGLPGTVVGAGLGGAAVDALERGVLSQVYPEYAQQSFGSPEARAATGRDMAMGAGLDAATMGLIKGAGPALSGIAPKLGQAASSVLGASPVSSALKGAGTAAQHLGGGVRAAAGAADNLIGHDLAGLAIPGAAEVGSAGFIAQAPAFLTRGAVSAADRLSKVEALRGMFPEIAKSLGMAAERWAKPSGAVAQGAEEAIQAGAERVAGALGREAPRAAAQARPRDIVGNMAEDAYRGVRERIRPDVKLDREIYGAARDQGFPAHAARDLAIDEVQRDVINAGAQTAQRFGRKVGAGIENLETFGKGAEQVARGVGRAAIKGTKAAAGGVKNAGTVARAAGTIGQPLEAPLAVRYGSEEYLSPYIEAYKRRMRTQNPYATVPSVLANN